MKLNEFLQDKLGVEFENKYNKLAVKEILKNKENYPLIAPIIVDTIKNEEEFGKKWNYESFVFDCYNDDCCANYDETVELYRAFVAAFSNELKDKPFTVKYASFGLDYLGQPNTHNILDPNFHYVGMVYISIFSKRTELGEELYYHVIPGKPELGILSQKNYNRLFYSDNEETLKEVGKRFKMLCEEGGLFACRFDNDGLLDRSVSLESNETGYPCDCYEIRIGKNLLRFFSTERGGDGFAAFRFPILDALTNEQYEDNVVKQIKMIS